MLPDSESAVNSRNMNLRKRPFPMWLAVAVLLVVTASSLTAQPVRKIWRPPYRNGIAAEVENRIITFEELRREMAPLIPQIQRESRNEREFDAKMAELYREIINSIIDRVLMVADFAEKEYKLPQHIVEDELDRMLITDFAGKRADFLESLREEGKSMREFRVELRESIIVSIMRGQMRRSQSEISPERINQFYSENKILFYQEESLHLRLIMLRPITEERVDLLLQQAETIIGELDSGTPFEDLAARYSQDSRRDRGGDWGWINRADLREELSSVAFSLGVGEYSDPIQLGNQVFILYVEDRRPEGIQPIDQVRDRIETILAQQLQRQTQRRYLERLREDAYIRFF